MNDKGKGESLAEAFPREQQRARELLDQYRSIGPDGLFGCVVIEEALRRADRAAASQDIVAMVHSYKELQGLK